MAKIAIDNGHGLNTPGKRTPTFPDGRQIREWEFNYPTAQKLKQVLERCGLETIMVSDTQEDTPLATRVSRANNAKADVFVSIHFNAFKGEWGTHGGVETHYYPTSEKGKRLAQLVQAELAKATGLRDRGIWASNFYVLRETKMPAILCECGFMDNMEEAKLMLDENYQWTVAEAIGRGICAYLGVNYVPKPEPKKEEIAPEGKFYKVQVGAFKERKNAEALLEQLKRAGFPGFIKLE
ncbi:N-acetylmuramoyl-L-alanine amidase [Caldicoprobacter algeriensis]|uniref:N-acetylmuramoyl-L-alanine amidase n=1 Tax=Caldicoprobacter algeriensis TaxID=699281 RepID=UPI00207A2720|nr:N-acetylmuramoyl-L-alanine amidase [Caldicoprobacter algeriensis]MCM8901337.1 N-acetylmuramoyl-L-alanine amidase [Caldicoprobacter algeriensis]